MKGNPTFPQCGFSRTVCEILKREGLAAPGAAPAEGGDKPAYHSVDVLRDPEIRQGIKEFSDWPTIPQLYVKGEFLGGCDIVRGMYEEGELKGQLEFIFKDGDK